ncbi:hypothetical protein LINPERPRIM_LOCUS4884 [Linum perenne]
MVDGVLQIPNVVVDLGVQRLETTIMAQLFGTTPPLKVITYLMNSLWGLGEPIYVSQISSGFLLIELLSLETQDWILARSWHVHHQPMILRRWHRGIGPIDLSPHEKPAWITFSGVPLVLLTNGGSVGWRVNMGNLSMNLFEMVHILVCVFC